MDGIFVGHHERTGASLFLSERGLLRGTRVQRKTADQRWDNEFVRKCRGVPWMLVGQELEVRPPPVPAVVMLAPEAIVRTPQQRRSYILKQDVARYGPTPGCEACGALAGGAQRVTKPHSDECRARMDELIMQRDEDALVQQRLHADRLRRGSMTAGASGDERRDPDVEMVGSGLPAGSSGDAPRARGTHENSGRGCRHETRIEKLRRITTSTTERETAHLVVENILMMMCHLSRQFCSKLNKQAAEAAYAHVSVGKMEMISRAAATMTNSAPASEWICTEIWTLAKTAIELFGASVSRFANKFTSYSIDSSLIIDMKNYQLTT